MEQHYYEQTEAQVRNWWASPRFETVKRLYTAKDVAQLRNSFHQSYPSNFLSQKLWQMLKTAQSKGDFHATWGALDPVQCANLAKYQDCIYVSGWQCSSTASTTNEPGPDFADYPYDTVPNKVDQLFKGLALQDRKQQEARARMTNEQRANTPKIDYMRPMIADGDLGFGGTTSIMKMMKLFIEAGAAGVHIEDQRSGAKKCGHMAGKVVVSTQEHCQRLQAARLQADIMGNEILLVGRTDALSSRVIDSNHCVIDQPYILGVVDPKNPKVLLTFPEAGVAAIKAKFNGAQCEKVLSQWNARCMDMGLIEAHAFAKSLGFEFFFDWNAPRTPEGFYQLKGSIEYCARRAREYLNYCDLTWMETPTPDLAVAKKFSDLVKVHHPKKLLAYNLSPSFNWTNIEDSKIASFCADLGKLGYAYQFITLAGFHTNALVTEKFSRDFAQRKMLAYVETVQREEKRLNVDQLTHQKWSGAELIDRQVTIIANDDTLSSSTKDSTENQFRESPKPKL